MRAALLGLLLVVLVCVPPAHAELADRPWPPRTDAPTVVHFGEEHWNDDDGGTVFPKVIEDVARYGPDLVTASGDKANNGVPDQLEKWREYMAVLDRAGIPYFAAVGNHDRHSGAAAPGTNPAGSFDNYRRVFSVHPYPMGDAPPLADPRFGPRARPADDPDGAASHYFVDFANSRWFFIDNSCFSITNCDPLQHPPDGAGLTQMEYLAKHGAEASEAGKLVFVVMHMPTRDPGDQTYREAVAVSHTMGKGASPDNTSFERAAAAVGVDGVFVGHIKGQFLYKGEGGVPYFIDGGAGGELYTDGPIGTDHGYWHGFRLLSLGADGYTTDAVPIFRPGTLRVEGPDRVLPGDRVRLFGFGRQPVFVNSAKVEALELRDPDPEPRSGSSAGLLWLVPVGLVVFLALGGTVVATPRLRVPMVAGTIAIGSGIGGVAVAQQSEPTSTPREALPNPARIWTTDNARVVAPVASETDDPRRDPRTQTADGAFVARCPGRTRVRLTSGWETTTHTVAVRSHEGRIVRSITRRRVVLEQAAVVRARVIRRGRTVARPVNDCRPAGVTRLRLPKRLRRGDRLVVEVPSDRRTIVRRLRLR